jgi:5-methylcytosine-specific restriction endonuclease McrBC regulatory subunit McrC
MELTQRGIPRNDLYQVTSYMYYLSSAVGGIVYPNTIETAIEGIGQLNGYGGQLIKIGLGIPQQCLSLTDFATKINEEEEKFSSIISKLIDNLVLSDS